jgi:hypothetical protein
LGAADFYLSTRVGVLIFFIYLPEHQSWSYTRWSKLVCQGRYLSVEHTLLLLLGLFYTVLYDSTLK